MIVGTYVTNKSESIHLEAVWKPHYAVVTTILLAAIVVPYFTTQLAQNEPFSDMLNVRTLVMNKPEVVYANIQESISMVSTVKTGTTKTTSITVQAFLTTDNIMNEAIARDIGDTVITNYSSANKKDFIHVALIYGYDIGIWSSWNTHNYKFTPQDLNKNNLISS